MPLNNICRTIDDYLRDVLTRYHGHAKVPSHDVGIAQIYQNNEGKIKRVTALIYRRDTA